MKIGINKSAKRVLSIALALVMLVGTLFTANVGVTITADAATDPTVEKTVVYWDGSNGAFPTKGAGTEANPYIIETPAQLHYVAMVAGPSNTTGKYFKVADNMIFVLQPQSVISDLASFKTKTAAEVKAFFAAEDGKVNWLTSTAATNPGVFNGFFNGNDVEIYGMYADGTKAGKPDGTKYSAGVESAGLFPNVDGGKGTQEVTITYNGKDYAGTVNDTDPVLFEKFSVMNSYVIGIRRAGVIFGTSQWAPGGAYVDGIIKFDALVVANNFVEGTANYTSSNGTAVTQSSRGSGEMGVLNGASGNDPVTAYNCLVYGNETLFTDTNGNTSTFCLMAGNSHSDRTYTTKVRIYGGLKNSLVLGTNVCGSCSNVNVTAGVYADQTTASGVVQVTDGANVKGLVGASKLGAFTWANKDTDLTDGNTYWFVRENDYPTPIQPASDYWKTVEIMTVWSGSAASEYAGGTGTKDDPFIIKTPEQLYRALSTATYSTSTSGDLAVETAESVAGGYQSDRILKQGSTTVYVPVYTPYYYKVADDVKALYLGDVIGAETKEGIHAAATGNKITEWKPQKTFVGYLDGNGATIYGMYSKSGQGLVYKLDGSATVKNFHFEACYTVRSMLTMNLGSYSNDSTLINVSNVSVRNSCLHGNTNFWIKANSSGELTQNQPGPSLISTSSTCEHLTISNCLFDGISCDVTYGDLYYDDGDNTDNLLLAETDDEMRQMIGGIISGGSSMNNVGVNGCVSLGSPIVDEIYAPGYEVIYTRYDKKQGFQVFLYNNYSDVPATLANAYPDNYDKLLDVERVDAKNVYDMYDMPKLAWGNWELVTEDARTIPVPIVSTSDKVSSSYIDIVGQGENKYAGVGPHAKGSNPYTYLLKGAGTEKDPYIIETSEQLARAIATGGMNLYDRLYYKLGNDIDISDGSWINQDSRAYGGIYYVYTPFGGSLDGNGHVVTGLNAGDNASAGLIPVLANGGVVKNIHVRDAYVVSKNSAGVIVGEQQAGSTITGCSSENSTVSMPGGGWHIIGSVAGAFDTLYFITADGKCLYVDENSALYGDYVADQGALDTFVANKVKQANSVWYIGGKEGSMPRLKNLNSHASDLDIVGDGKADGYGAADLSALRNKLLKKSAYNYINGDVSRNGNINLADLAVLQRTIIEDDVMLTDNFFNNVEAGQVKIYYGENDNYDAARKVELYLESLFPGTDVPKCVSSSKGTVTGANSDSSKVYLHEGDKAESPDGKLDIIVGTLDNVSAYSANTVATAANSYAVTYDSANKVVWIQGANFTAVEQAAINFVNGCAVDGDKVYTCDSTVLAAEKQPITVKLDANYDGTIDTDKTFYYAWGDEFEEDTLNTYNWTHNSQQAEAGNGALSAYWNQEIAPVKDYDKMIVVDNGRLSMKRGYDKNLGTSTNGTVPLDVTPGEFNGYTQWIDGINGENAIDADGSDQYFSSGKIITERGMLFKQGYLEIQGQLPADGHAFPAWWLMGRPSQSANNNGYDKSLYSKVYKLNDNWDGITNSWDKDNLDTFKYQIPTVIYEIDMIEVMQHGSRYGALKQKSSSIVEGWLANSYYSSSTTYSNSEAVAWYMINSTIHKYYNNGVDNQNTDDTSDDVLHIADWDNYKIAQSIPKSNFSTSSSAGTWIHNIGSTELDFGTPTRTKSGSTYYAGDYDYNKTASEAGRTNLEATRRYGFSWNTSESGFEATLYVYNTDGTLWQTVPIASGMSDYSAFKDGSKNVEDSTYTGVYSDKEVFNQYMYILLDNKFYSSNPSGYSAGNSSYKNKVVQFTDLLTAAGLTSLEVDYVRIYQEDDFRDIVTPETESFNNNNHFGYF